MKLFLLFLIMTITTTSFATVKLPADLTDDLLKTISVELLINNIKENYQVTQLTAGRLDDSGYEMAAAFVTIIKASDGICMKIAATVKADTCTNIQTNCKLDAYALDCKESEQFSSDIFGETNLGFTMRTQMAVLATKSK